MCGDLILMMLFVIQTPSSLEWNSNCPSMLQNLLTNNLLDVTSLELEPSQLVNQQPKHESLYIQLLKP